MNTEVDILSVMYEGDKNRDAADKIRGFLFQDYVTIMCLLQNQVKYVWSEYLEDVDVFFEDGTFEFISKCEGNFDRSLLSVSPYSDASEYFESKTKPLYS